MRNLSELCPGEDFLLPCPGEAGDEEEEEDQHGEAVGGAEVGELGGEGQQEDGFDIEDEEDDGVEVVAGLEGNPGVAGGFEAALVDGVLVEAGFLRGEFLCPEPCEG